MLEAYKLSRKMSYSNPIKEMRREKQLQIESLYDLAADREDGVLKNGIPFIQSPRIYGFKKKDDVHSLMTVEVVNKDDWFEVGDYIEYNGGHWLCMNASNFHGMYCVGTFQLCNWKLYWMNGNGQIKSAYCIDYNSTQYNSGESSNKPMTLGSAQHMLYMQCNTDTIILNTPLRFVVDKNIDNPTCYKVTQNDNSTYNYGKGLCCVTITETELNRTTDKLVVLDNNEKVWICDYYSPTPEPEPQPDNTKIVATISGRFEIKIGKTGIFFVAFTDFSGNEVIDYNFEWHVVGKGISSIADGKTIKITVDNNEELIDSSILLQVIVNKKIVTQNEIFLTDGF